MRQNNNARKDLPVFFNRQLIGGQADDVHTSAYNRTVLRISFHTYVAKRQHGSDHKGTTFLVAKTCNGLFAVWVSISFHASYFGDFLFSF